MATLHTTKPRVWGGSIDSEGYRTYKATFVVEADPATEGPYSVMRATNLPVIGTIWDWDTLVGTSSGSGSAEIDPWAFRHPETEVSIHPDTKEGDRVRYYLVDTTWSTKPINDCREAPDGNPLNQPLKLSGSFVRYSKEIAFDRWNDPIVTSSHEQIRGPQVEFPASNATVSIEGNFAALNLYLVTSMMNRVNDAALWGMPARHVMLSQASWSRKQYGKCIYYYTWKWDFEVNFDGFDRYVPDEGTKALRGHWDNSTAGGTWVLDDIGGSAPDPDNPAHFIQFKDRNGENCRVLLNGAGLPALASFTAGTGTGTDSTGSVAQIKIEHANEANFLLLGVPSSLTA